MDAYNIIIYLFLLLIVAFFLVVSKTIEYYRYKKIYEHIACCFHDSLISFRSSSTHESSNNYFYRCASNFLWNYLPQANVENTYRITEDENNFAIDIIKKFQQWLLELYLLGRLNTREYAKLETKPFLIRMLQQFLSENKYEKEFNKQEMFVREKKENGITLYHLTDYSRVYYKMLYISLCYCDIIQNISTPETKKIKQYIDNEHI